MVDIGGLTMLWTLKSFLLVLAVVIVTGLLVITNCPLAVRGDLLSTGYEGQAFERGPGGGIGPLIQGVALTFVKEDGSHTFESITDSQGRYRMPLAPGRYWVRAVHQAYEDYVSIPGFFVVPAGQGFQTGNVFLRQPKVTTLLTVRHADRTAEDDLTSAGQQRAQQLAEVARKAGVTAIYTTDFQRTRKTAQPLADLLKLEPVIYDSPIALVNQVLADHAGDVVLVVGHGPSVPIIAKTFGAAIPTTLFDDFDNMLVVTRKLRAATATAVNLQYGASIEPDDPSTASAYATTTILLVRNSEGGQSGGRRAENLKEVVRKAHVTNSPVGTTTLYASQQTGAQQILQPLASYLNLAINPYSSNDLETFVNRVKTNHVGKLVVVAANAGTTRQILSLLKASPYPVVLPAEYDDLLVLTFESPDQVKVVDLQYGDPSPFPQLVSRGTELYTANGKQWVRYKLAIANSGNFSADLFTLAPNLPPCGLNTNASRTWVDIYNSATNQRIYGFCAFTSPQDLGSLWFAVEQGTTAPQQVHIVLTDRRANITYRSNPVTLR
jgi:phosphohistidine phosphatase SixA